MPTAQVRPRSLKPCRNGALKPYPASARTQPKRTPAARTRSISTSAISSLVIYFRRSSGTAARSSRAASLTQLSGRNSLSPTMIGTSPDARVSDTSVWQLAFLPSAEVYCGATPTECSPFLGSAVSSMISQASSRPTILSASASSTLSTGAASHGPLAIKSCRHRLDALAVTRADQSPHIGRAHLCSRLVPQRTHKRREPAFQIGLPVLIHRRPLLGRPLMNHANRNLGILKIHQRLKICQSSARVR